MEGRTWGGEAGRARDGERVRKIENWLDDLASLTKLCKSAGQMIGDSI